MNEPRARSSLPPRLAELKRKVHVRVGRLSRALPEALPANRGHNPVSRSVHACAKGRTTSTDQMDGPARGDLRSPLRAGAAESRDELEHRVKRGLQRLGVAFDLSEK